MAKLTNEQFKKAFQQGLGRAYQHVHDHGDSGIVEEIVNGCIKDLNYDSQCEESRADWVFKVLEKTGHQLEYWHRILDRIPVENEFNDLYQQLDLAVLFAKNGVKEARPAIYKKFNLQEFKESWIGGDQILELDGIQGLLHISKTIGKRLLKNEELDEEEQYWEDESMLQNCIEKWGEADVMEALNEEAKSRKEVEAYLKEVLPHCKKRTKTKRKIPPQLYKTLDDVFLRIDNKPEYKYYHLKKFGESASEADLEQIRDKLLNDPRPESQITCLSVLIGRLPGSWVSQLFPFAESENENVSSRAFEAIGKIKSPVVHEFAKKLIKQKGTSANLELLLCFSQNYSEKDRELIEPIISDISDRDTCHFVGQMMLDIWDGSRDQDPFWALDWVYENSPCSNCRLTAVQGLIESKQISNEHLEECRFDCETDIRAAATKALESLG